MLLRTMVLLSFAIGLWPVAANACSCGRGEEARYPVGPEKFPLNVRVWTENPKYSLYPNYPDNAIDCPSPIQTFPWARLNEEHEVVEHVDYHTTKLSEDLWVSIPDQSLLAGGLYDLGNLDWGPVRMGDQVDHTPPSIESFIVSDIVIGSGVSAACGDSYYAVIDVETDGDIVVVDVEGKSDFDPRTFCGAVSDATMVPPGSKFASVIVGRAQCGSSSWPRARRGDELRYRVGSLDLAGNFSGWSEERSVTLSNCACQAGGRPSAELTWMLLGFWGLRAVARRRREAGECSLFDRFRMNFVVGDA